MLKNYFLIAWRNLLKNRTFSLINIFGLAISVCSCLLMVLYVHHELTYDQYHEKANRIVRLSSRWITPENEQRMVIVSQVAAPAILQAFPEVEAAVRLEPFCPECYFKKGEELVDEKLGVYQTDAAIFDVFTFHFQTGHRPDGWGPGMVLLNRELADKYFGATNAVGRSVELSGKTYQVAGVFENYPGNVDLPIRALVYKDFPAEWRWGQLSSISYLLLKEQAGFEALASRLPAFSEKHLDPVFGGAFTMKLEAEPLLGLHFAEGIMMDNPKGNIIYVRVFVVAAVFLLLVALFNFVNLSAIGSMDRTREVGVRKVVGASRKQLLQQFLVEYCLTVSLSMLAAGALLQLLIPPFNELTGGQFHASMLLEDHLRWIGLGIVLLPVLAAVYPGLILAGHPPVFALKGKPAVRRQRLGLFWSLVVAQFTISAMLMIGMYAVYSQLDFIRKKDLGYRQEEVVFISLPRQLDLPFEALKRAFEEVPGVAGVSLAAEGGLPGAGSFIGNVATEVDGQQKEAVVHMVDADDRYVELMGLQLSQGSSFSGLDPGLMDRAIVVNEAFVKQVGWSEPVGQKVITPMGPPDQPAEIVGVLKDYHYASLHNPIEPMLISWRKFGAEENSRRGLTPQYLIVQASPDLVPAFQELWYSLLPSQAFEFRFMDASIQQLYHSEQLMMQVFGYFTVIALCVASLGLFGLTSYLLKLRTKEIGIRKVLGAEVWQMVALLSRNLLLMVGIAGALAVPMAWWGIEQWLQNYAYKIELSWWAYVMPALVVALLATLSVVVRLTKAANTNPVEALRTE